MIVLKVLVIWVIVDVVIVGVLWLGKRRGR